MRLIPFDEMTTVIAKDQPEYLPLPAHVRKDDPKGTTTFCWALSWKERLVTLWRGKLWHQVLTFHHPLQPQMLQVDKPKMETVVWPRV